MSFFCIRPPQSVRDNTERYDGLWLFTVASGVKFTSFLRDERRLRVSKRYKMDSELSTCLLKLSISQSTFRYCRRTLLRFFWTTFVERAVYIKYIKN